MHAHATPQNASPRRIGLRLTEQSLAPQVRIALQNLGYLLIDLDSEPAERAVHARVWLVDEERLDELPRPQERPELRIALFSTEAQIESAPPRDERVFARVTRPGRLAPVYEMLQTALEGTPRRVPRVTTRLSARCIYDRNRSMGAVLSSSEGGCLLRSTEGFDRGAQIDLQFALPKFGLISTPAECRYAEGTDVGLAFAEANQETRHTIAHYVAAQLAAGEAAAQLPRAVSA
jgi:hypothetical protein